jgi:hypothetical protein
MPSDPARYPAQRGHAPFVNKPRAILSATAVRNSAGELPDGFTEPRELRRQARNLLS